MKKQQAYELAEKELQDKNIVGFGYHYTKAKDRSMEIYAAAFAEWAIIENYTKIPTGSWIVRDLIVRKRYTIAELITEFEKS